MSMQPKGWSINALSVELDIDRRTLAKYLVDLRPVEVQGNVKFYRLKEVLDKLQPLLDCNEKALDDPVERFKDFLQRFCPDFYGELAFGLAFLIREATDLPSDRVWRIFEEGCIFVYFVMAEVLECDRGSVMLKTPDLLIRLRNPTEREKLIKWLDSRKRAKEGL